MPLGYANDAREHANETHHLPLPPNAMGEYNFLKIYEEVKQFISPRNDLFSEAEKQLVVFTMSSEMRVIKSFIEQFSDESVSSIRVFKLEDLFFLLKRKSQEMGVVEREVLTVTSIFQSNILLEDDPNQNRHHLACKVSKLGGWAAEQIAQHDTNSITISVPQRGGRGPVLRSIESGPMVLHLCQKYMLRIGHRIVGEQT